MKGEVELIGGFFVREGVTDVFLAPVIISCFLFSEKMQISDNEYTPFK